MWHKWSVNSTQTGGHAGHIILLVICRSSNNNIVHARQKEKSGKTKFILLRNKFIFVLPLFSFCLVAK